MSIKHTLNKNLFIIYAKLKYPLPIWEFLNKKSRNAFQKNKPELNAVQKRILSDLKEFGIATVDINDLFPDENILQTYRDYAEKLKQSGSTNHKKKFLKDYWDEVVKLDLNNPFLEHALKPKILDIVNSYMEMQTKLLYFTLQETIPSKGELTNSQNWHRDPQEQKVVKVFTYLNDIDETSGPFTYVKHSAPTQDHYYAKLFPQQPPAGSYPGNEEVEAAVPEADITPMIAKAGTVIFCDTNGLHYGGVATENSRLMSTFGYSAPTYRENKMYYYNKDFLNKIKDLPQQSRFSIREKWMSK